MIMRAIIINQNDNVAVVLQDTPKGSDLQIGSLHLTAEDDMVAGHKVALQDIAKGEYILKYGKPIGEASADIKKGHWAHCHNIKDITEQLCDEFARAYRAQGGEE
jgi:hypothetical protein